MTIGAIIIGATMGLLATHTESMILVYIACFIMEITPAVRMLNNLQYNTLIHHSIKSIERGTVLSTRAMVSTALGAVALVLAKFLMDGYGITVALISVFVLTILLILSLKSVAKYIEKR